MIPGMRGMNPRKMQQMMKQMGIDVEDVEDVKEVIIRTSNRDIVFNDAQVTIMNVRGAKTYQVVGTPEERQRELEATEADVQLVVEQSGASESEARKALKETEGDLAEAILKLK
ncbi:MAG: nascent polypeptide-associated complex protein [Methanosarcinales archaeon Met12]|nr:MAG: nascent polypeptide-associated complex protein [Methanosarcinales archaeon Met12]